MLPGDAAVEAVNGHARRRIKAEGESAAKFSSLGRAGKIIRAG
jgi:hypothetical protein